MFDLALRPVPERRVKTRLTCVPGSTREGNIVDGLASRGVHHRRGLFRSLRVAPADFRPGTRPAHPGPEVPGVSWTVVERVLF